jgi:glycosyltransferase involved in cell wall biosynthesis
MPDKMKVIVDGVIYQLQLYGGISRVFSGILPRMCSIDDSLRIRILTQGLLKQSLPKHAHITSCSIPYINHYPYPKRLWKPVINTANKLIYRLKTGSGKDKIWHSTYYTIPEKWTGYSVATVHDMVFELFPQFYGGPNFDLFRQRKRLSVQRADAVICVSDTTRHDVLQFYELDEEKVHVVPNACNDVFRRLDSTELSRTSQIEQPFLLYIGNRARYKNFDVLAKAYSIWHRRKDVALVLVGARPWSDGEWRQLAQLQVQSRIQLLQDVDDKTLCRLYNSAAAFVYPSLREGFGIPLLEAMACGCPIIASRIPSTVEVAGDCPAYFEPGKADDLLRAFDVVLSEGRNSGRVQLGFERARLYSWDKTAAQTLQIYRAVCH